LNNYLSYINKNNYFDTIENGNIYNLFIGERYESD